MKNQNLGFVFFGSTEVVLGSVTLISLLASLLLGKSAKPPEVIIFVFCAALISLVLGVGILKRNLASYHALLFFSAAIVLSKVLIFAKIITLNGALETIFPPNMKNAVSIIYHSLLIWYFKFNPFLGKPRPKGQEGL